MEKIKTIYLGYLPAEVHFDYMNQLSELVEEFPAVKNFMLALSEALAVALAKESALINMMKKSDYTVLIAEADNRVDRCITGMNATINAGLHSPNHQVLEAAQSLHNRFRAFGDIGKKSYEAETTDVNLLLADLASAEYAAKVTLLGLTAWVTELTAAEAAFEALYKQRSIETSEKPQGRIRDARRETDAIYHSMINNYNAWLLLYSVLDPEYYAFAARLNAIIDHFNERYHHAKKDLSAGDHCVIEPVGTQAYTERAITPVPKVHYRTEGKPTAVLSLGKDFEVTYKNNVNVGMAEVTVHGKGDYKGKKMTTFMIAR
jgi:hypothetical protein